MRLRQQTTEKKRLENPLILDLHVHQHTLKEKQIHYTLLFLDVLIMTNGTTTTVIFPSYSSKKFLACRHL